MERKAKIILTSKKISLSQTEFDSVRSIVEQALESEIPGVSAEEAESLRNLDEIFKEIDGEEDVSELICDCNVFFRQNGGVVIRYEESELTGMEGCITKLMFSKSKPDFIVMMREGSVHTSLSFEAGKRHISTYNTPYMPFRLCVNTLRVKNTFIENGEIEVEYLIEVRGLSTEKNTMNIKVNYID